MSDSIRDMDPKLQRIFNAYLKERDAKKEKRRFNKWVSPVDKGVKLHRKKTLKRSDRYQAKRDLKQYT